MTTHKRLIDANILEERVNQEPTDGMFKHEIIAAIKEQPTVDDLKVQESELAPVVEQVRRRYATAKGSEKALLAEILELMGAAVCRM